MEKNENPGQTDPARKTVSRRDVLRVGSAAALGVSLAALHDFIPPNKIAEQLQSTKHMALDTLAPPASATESPDILDQPLPLQQIGPYYEGTIEKPPSDGGRALWRRDNTIWYGTWGVAGDLVLKTQDGGANWYVSKPKAELGAIGTPRDFFELNGAVYLVTDFGLHKEEKDESWTFLGMRKEYGQSKQLGQ